MKLEHYFENPEKLHVGCEENRAYYIPYSSVDAALARGESDRLILLSGVWKFKYYNSIYECPGLDEADLDEIPVPSCWQNHGYDTHQYTNVRYPFPYDPPYVPHKNPCGLYTRDFELKKGEDRYYINFEGVDSCFYLWINGDFAGYSQVSHSTSEFEITDKLTDGKNTVHVLVLKWCDGSYLEDQDKFRMSGIFRDVYILRRDKEHIRDFFIKTRSDGTVTVKTDGTEALITLIDGKKELCRASGAFAEFKIDNPKPWTAETPYLYTMLLQCGGEVIAQRVGLREIYIRDGIVYVNGKLVHMRGVNRHDSDPVTGYTISREQALKDLRLMKECGINAIRTSHYPNAPWFTEMCDEYGFYVIAETDLEAHGCCQVYGGSQAKTFGLTVQNPIFETAVIDRVQRCVTRDKNRPCVLLWSLGNEAGYGRSLEKALEWLKAYDPTRLTHYEGAVHETLGHKNDTSLLDVYSTMYASPEWIDEYFANPENKKPYMQCEYIHAMGNGPGSIEDYVERMDKYAGFFAAFVWEWCDHGIYKGMKNGRKVFWYGGDHGEYPHDANFCMDGLVYPDRTPHTGLWEYKNTIRPIRARLENGSVVFENRLDFLNTRDILEIKYTLMQGGKPIQSGSLGSPDIEPHGTFAAEAPSGADGVIYTYVRLRPSALVKANTQAGFDYIELREVREPAASHGFGVVGIFEDETSVCLAGESFKYKYNKLRGVFEELKEPIKAPLEWNIWRAPTDNDRNVLPQWQRAGYDRAYSRAYETRTSTVQDGAAVIETHLAIVSAIVQRIVDINAKWTVYPDGDIRLYAVCRHNDEMPFLPRFGLRTMLDKCAEKVEYFGWGPYESYIDKKTASYPAVFEATVDELHEDYVKPQENGAHYGCKMLSLTDGTCKAEVRGDGFSFNASHYTIDELTKKAHNYELERSSDIELCVDFAQSGIGSNSCGPELSEERQVRGEFVFEIELHLEK